MSPEIYRKLPFDGHAIDVWAAGTVLLFMLTGKRLSNPPLIDRAFEGVELGLSHEATDLLRKMFRLEPKDRLTLEQIKMHPFVTYQFLCQR
jgi:serine/threonine protein kinase